MKVRTIRSGRYTYIWLYGCHAKNKKKIAKLFKKQIYNLKYWQSSTSCSKTFLSRDNLIRFQETVCRFVCNQKENFHSIDDIISFVWRLINFGVFQQISFQQWNFVVFFSFLLVCVTLKNKILIKRTTVSAVYCIWIKKLPQNIN